MRIQASKTMASFINKMKKAGELKIEHAELITLNERAYSVAVGDPIDNMADYDFDDDGFIVFKVIVIVYPDNYHACNRYITTSELKREYRRLRVKNAESLKGMLKEMIEV